MKPKGDVTINDLELAALFAQVQIFAPEMDTLSHICIAVENAAAQGWNNLGNVRTATAVGPILQDPAFLTRTHKICGHFYPPVGPGMFLHDCL